MAGLKRVIAQAAHVLGGFPLGLSLQKAVYGSSFVRVINYHDTPARHAVGFERQLQFYLRSFEPAGPEDLKSCLQGKLRSARPKLLITFDDGYRSNYEVAAGLLEKYGFRGWFFLPVGLIHDTRAEADEDFAQQGPEEPEPRMTWSEARDLSARGHGLGCHSRSHVRLEDRLAPEQVRDEITLAGQDMAAKLGFPIEDFCWVGGEEWSYGVAAFNEVRRAGYARAFMTNLSPVSPSTNPLWIQRTNIEAHWPQDEVELYLSGLMDLAYLPKRRRVARKLSGSN